MEFYNIPKGPLVQLFKSLFNSVLGHFQSEINNFALLIFLPQERHCGGDSRYDMRHVCGVDTLGCYDRCA